VRFTVTTDTRSALVRAELPAGDYIDVPALARAKGIHRTTFYELMRAGKAPRPVRGVPRALAEAWLHESSDDAPEEVKWSDDSPTQDGDGGWQDLEGGPC